jgi:hypothetical protein
VLEHGCGERTFHLTCELAGRLFDAAMHRQPARLKEGLYAVGFVCVAHDRRGRLSSGLACIAR